MQRRQAAKFFPGTIVVISPHMDDGELACGGTVASLPDKDNIHFIYIADGTRSPTPVLPHLQPAKPNLAEIRMQESRAALRVLGLPAQNIHFLSYPDARLGKYLDDIRSSLGELLTHLNPAHIFIPFRYDRHPDHLAVHHAAQAAIKGLGISPLVYEYFVYYKWRLLPKGDVRAYILPKYLISADISSHIHTKRKALDCHVSQVTKFFPWQYQPVLSGDLLGEFSRGPEIFLISNSAPDDHLVFSSARMWIRIVHSVEPLLKRSKYRLMSFWHTVVRQNRH